MKHLKFYSKLKAGSILESVIAITIISISSLIAFTIYLNVIKSNTSIVMENAKQTLVKLINKSELENNIEDEEFVYDNYKIEKRGELNKKEHIARVYWLIKTTTKKKEYQTIMVYNED